ncbi:hypothetical protein D9M71_588990 [compost metagenome]
MGSGRSGAQYVGRLGGQVASTIGAHHYHGSGTVGHQAAVTHAQRVGHHARTQHILEAQVVAHVGVGVELRPFTRRHGDLGQVLARGAVLVHVPRGGQGIGRHRVHRTVRRFPGRRARRLHQLA